MKVKVQDLQSGMIVIDSVGKGVLKVNSVEPTITELFPQQYLVTFAGIREQEQVGENTEYEVLG